MEEIIKILEEHNIKCVWDGNDLSLSHKNFYVNIEDVESRILFDDLTIIEIKNKKIVVDIYYTFEHIHVMVLGSVLK